VAAVLIGRSLGHNPSWAGARRAVRWATRLAYDLGQAGSDCCPRQLTVPTAQVDGVGLSASTACCAFQVVKRTGEGLLVVEAGAFGVEPLEALVAETRLQYGYCVGETSGVGADHGSRGLVAPAAGEHRQIGEHRLLAGGE
jgi:hypothetical protein